MPDVLYDGLFESEAWTPALEKYAGVTHLTLELYDAKAQLVCGPVHHSSLFDLLAPSLPGRRLLTECLTRCLRRTDRRVVLARRLGLAVIGTPLVLGNDVVGALVAGYHLLEYPQSIAVERFARDAALPAARVFDVLRQQRPVAHERCLAEGELLQALAETLLQETYRTRQQAELSAQLQAANAAKDQFLALVSHELRGPLNAILGWARLLRTNQLKETAKDHALDTIERNAQAQARLIGDLLDISRILAGKMEIERQPVLLQSVIDAAIESAKPSADAKQIHLDAEFADGPQSVAGDPIQLQQIASNLLSNAIKFTPADGHVLVGLTRRGHEAELSVADTGDGISSEFLPHVFEPFRQQDGSITRRHGGLGLGLAIADRLVALHGGSIRAESAGGGQGARFTVRLPRLAAPGDEHWSNTDPNAENHRSAGPMSSQTLVLADVHVLIVEDDADARELLHTALRGAGAEVTAVASAADALIVLDRERPQVLVSDIGLPHEDGYALIRKVRQRSPDDGGGIPAIAVTAWASAGDRDRARAAGYDLHLPKPVDAPRLIRSIAGLARQGHTPAGPLN